MTSTLWWYHENASSLLAHSVEWGVLIQDQGLNANFSLIAFFKTNIFPYLILAPFLILVSGLFGSRSYKISILVKSATFKKLHTGYYQNWTDHRPWTPWIFTIVWAPPDSKVWKCLWNVAVTLKTVRTLSDPNSVRNKVFNGLKRRQVAIIEYQIKNHRHQVLLWEQSS